MINILYQSVFISYARTEGNFVNQLETDLQRHQIHTWIDHSNIQDGSNWLDTIEQAIQQCDVLLIILSQQAIVSEYVKMEYRYARYLNKRIIPLYYLPCSLIPIDLHPLQWIDFSKSYEDGFNHLIATLECKEQVSKKSSNDYQNISTGVKKVQQCKQASQKTVTALLRRGQCASLTEHYEEGKGETYDPHCCLFGSYSCCPSRYASCRLSCCYLSCTIYRSLCCRYCPCYSSDNSRCGDIAKSCSSWNGHRCC